MNKPMDMDDLEMLAKIIWRRKAQRLDRRVCDLEQERYRLFLWLMQMMDEQIEREWPPTGKVIRRFDVEKHGQRCTRVSTTGISPDFVTIPTVDSDEFIPVVAQVVDFIEQLEGWTTINRFPKDSRTEIREFLLVADYKK